VAVGRHNELASIGVLELDSYVGVADAEAEEVSGAEVPELAEVHRRSSERGPHRVPVEVQRRF
jgi:hypothetical protein